MLFVNNYHEFRTVITNNTESINYQKTVGKIEIVGCDKQNSVVLIYLFFLLSDFAFGS